MTRYFMVERKAMDMLLPTEIWLTRNRGTVYCGECGVVRDRKSLPEVWIVDDALPCPVDFVQLTGLGVLRNDLIDILGWENVERELILGQLFHERTGQTADGRSFVGREPIYARGSEESIHDRCAQCGLLSYVPRGRAYLLRSAVSARRAIYEDFTAGLIVREDLAAPIREQLSGTVRCYELPILESPEDGLPAELVPSEAYWERTNPHTGQMESKELYPVVPPRGGGAGHVQLLWPDDRGAVDPFYEYRG